MCTECAADVCICACMRSDVSVTGVSSPCQFRESKAVF